jgi:PKD repeat protein
MFFLRFVTLFAVVLFFSSCSSTGEFDENNPPNAIFSFVPENADVTTVFTFDASASEDVEDPKGLLTFKWDFEGSHNWVSSKNNPIINYKYNKPGTYEAVLKVIDAEGWTGQTSKTIIVRDTL